MILDHWRDAELYTLMLFTLGTVMFFAVYRLATWADRLDEQETAPPEEDGA